MTFSCIVADPPWNVKAGRSLGAYVKQGGRQLFGPTNQTARSTTYESLSVDEIAALDVASLAAADAHLYLWTINAYLPQAYAIAQSWGFKPSTLLVWAKKPMGGGLGGTFGLSTEFCLFCRRGKLPAKRRVTGSWFQWKRPYENGYPKHSAKPPEFFNLVESVSPGPYLELFARDKKPGWASWGNEIPNDVALARRNHYKDEI